MHELQKLMRGLTSVAFTEHALERLARRSIAESEVRLLLASPDVIRMIRPGRIVAQKVVHLGSQKRQYLIRVFVDVDRVPPRVVSAYRTSKIAKYGDFG